MMKFRKILTQRIGYASRLVFEGDRLIGASFVDLDIFPWVFRYLMREKIDVGSNRHLLFENPKQMSPELLQESRL